MCYSESEAEADGRIDSAMVEIAVRQSTVHLREHQTTICIELWREPPINEGGNCVERSSALRVGLARTVRSEVAALVVMVIGTDQIQIVGYAVFDSGPYDLQMFVAEPCARAESCIADVRIVNGRTAEAEKIPRNIGKRGLGIAGRCVLDPFVTGINVEWSSGVFGEQHHTGIVGYCGSESLRQKRCYGHAAEGGIPGKTN